MNSNNWQPAPRETATLTSIKNRAFLIGGLNFDANKEIGQLKIKGLEHLEIETNEPDWQNVDI
jgi:hypothetical protein